MTSSMGDDEEANLLTPACHVESSRRPELQDLISALECFSCAALCSVIIAFALACVVLALNYNEDVLSKCGEYWDFACVSLLSPLALPLVFCCFSCFSLQPNSLYIAYFGCFSAVGIAMNISVTSECVASMRHSTPPLPWLYFLGWMKSVLFLASFISAACKQCSRGA